MGGLNSGSAQCSRVRVGVRQTLDAERGRVFEKPCPGCENGVSGTAAGVHFVCRPRSAYLDLYISPNDGRLLVEAVRADSDSQWPTRLTIRHSRRQRCCRGHLLAPRCTARRNRSSHADCDRKQPTTLESDHRKFVELQRARGTRAGSYSVVNPFWGGS